MFAALRFKHVYFCYKVQHFNIELYQGWLAFEIGLKWQVKELQFLALNYWLLILAMDVAACFVVVMEQRYNLLS